MTNFIHLPTVSSHQDNDFTLAKHLYLLIRVNTGVTEHAPKIRIILFEMWRLLSQSHSRTAKA